MARARTLSPKRSRNIQSKIQFDFTGYALFDDIVMEAKEDEVYRAMHFNPSKVEQKRFFAYRELFFNKQCAVVKYLEQKDVERAMLMYCGAEVLDRPVFGMNVKVYLNLLCQLENHLYERVKDFGTFIETKVVVLNVDDSGGPVENIKTLMSQFGTIKDMEGLGYRYDTYGNCVVTLNSFSGALAAQIAYNETSINGRFIVVTTRRRREETVDAMFSYETEHPEDEEIRVIKRKLAEASFY